MKNKRLNFGLLSPGSKQFLEPFKSLVKKVLNEMNKDYLNVFFNLATNPISMTKEKKKNVLFH